MRKKGPIWFNYKFSFQNKADFTFEQKKCEKFETIKVYLRKQVTLGFYQAKKVELNHGINL